MLLRSFSSPLSPTLSPTLSTTLSPRYQDAASLCCLGAAALIAVYDVTRPESLQYLDKQLERIAGLLPTGDGVAMPVVTLVANKARSRHRLVEAEEGAEYALTRGMGYIETDAIDGMRCKELFYRTVQSVVRAIPEAAVQRGPSAFFSLKVRYNTWPYSSGERSVKRRRRDGWWRRSKR